MNTTKLFKGNDRQGERKQTIVCLSRCIYHLSTGCHYSLDWTTGLEYWTEVVSFFGQGSMILVYFQIFDT